MKHLNPIECWNMIKKAEAEATALITALIKQIFEDDPSLLIPPAVTDGSLAEPGTIGEVWSTSITGNWSGGGSTTVPPAANFVVVQPPLPPGDWEVTWQMVLPAVGNAGVGAMVCRLAPVPAGALNDMTGYAVNIPTNMAPGGVGAQPLVVNGPVVPMSIAMMTALVFNLYIWPSGVMPNGPYTMDVWARRVR